MNNDSTQKASHWAFITVFIALLLAVLPHWIQPGFYFDDDIRHYFMVSIHEIGNRLLRGEWPTLSLRSAYSGNFIGEGQFGLFNPITLFLFALVSKINDLALSSLLYASAHLVLMALGVFTLARRINLSPAYACLVALAFVGSNFNSYWYASSWWNALSCNTWLVWSAAAWLYVFQGQRWLIAATLSTAAVLTSGWVHGAFALAMIVMTFAITYLKQDFSKRIAFPLIAGGISAILLSLPALVPLLGHVEESQRSVASITQNGTMVATLDSLFSLSWGSYIPSMPLFFFHKTIQPDFYCAWFILPIFIIYWQDFKRNYNSDNGHFKALTLLSFIFLVLSLGPEQIGPARWPIRFVSYFHLTILLLTGKLASNNPPNKINTFHLVIFWSIGFIMSWQQSPENAGIHATFSCICLLASYLFIKTRNESNGVIIKIITTILIFSITHLIWPVNMNITHWQTPIKGSLNPEPAQSFSNVLIMQQSTTDVVDEWKEFPSGNVGQWESRSFINGYSPVQFTGLQQGFCLNWWSWVCPDAVDKLFAIDKASGKDVATLWRVSEVRAKAGPLALAMNIQGNTHGFRRVKTTRQGEVWQHDLPSLPGSISWTSPNIQISRALTFENQSESIEVANSTSNPGEIVWARTAFKGYEARLDDKALTILPYRNMLVSVQIPPHTKGQVTLVYRPFGWRWTTPLALLGLMMTLFSSYFLKRLSHTNSQTTFRDGQAIAP